MMGTTRTFFSLTVMCFAGGVLAADPPPEQIEFFEKNIRPIFAETCAKCHSQKAEKLKGGLLLDSREGVLKGGDSGPAIVAGNPEASLLIKAVRYKDEKLQMPPKVKLADAQIADLEAWVKMGAPDPRAGAVVDPFAAILEKGKKHWAFQPITKPPLPKNHAKENPIDAFVRAKLETNQLSPSPPADKRTLIRRATLDLLGLPPTPEEVAAFLADQAPNAYQKVLDRLLASPQYGERWGRYWLDVARYADTKGYVGGNEETRFPYAYTYRDWVIRAFNEDLPYDQFLIQQIAADLLKTEGDNRSLAALGFLTLGRRFVNDANDIIDDRMDVICRGTMALTVGCARCHDHKYDPIPTKDYYALHGVFNSVNEPAEKPLLDKQPPHPDYNKFVEELNKAQNEYNQYVAQNESAVLAKLRSTVGEYLMTVHADKNLNDEQRDKLVRRDGKLNIAVHNRWKGKLEEWKKKPDPVFAPWFALEPLPDAEFAAKAKELAAKFAGNADPAAPLNIFVAKIFAGDPPTELKQVADRYGKLFAEAETHWQAALADAGQKKVPLPTALADVNEEALRQILYVGDAPANPPRDKFAEYFLYTDDIKNMVEILKKKITVVDVTHPAAPPRAMVLKDNPKPANSHVFIRGNPGTQGPEVPRQFLEILSGADRKPFPADTSGRLQLAQAVASPHNPLTARVFVNRVWEHHLGAGLVATLSDFGTRASPPTHPELLDFLAAQFIEEGWSVKKLHRHILLSATYQQGSAGNERNARRDPDNKFLWRVTPRRLDFEAMRDSLLAVSAKLDPKLGGKPVDLVVAPFTNRRTVYGFIDRQELPQLFRTFDFANPDTSAATRHQTIVAQQALFLLNNPFVIECARFLAVRPELTNLFEGDERVRRLYQLLYQRDPTPHEIELAKEYIRANPAKDLINPEATAWSYGYGAYEEKTHHVNFTPFPLFTGAAWQVSPQLPDPQIQYTHLTAEGGHPGVKVIAIRRWTAPRDGRITIRGELAHPAAGGDGVRGRIVSSSNGELGQWKVHNNSAVTVVEQVQVKKGDMIDFLIDCLESDTGDTFRWSPSIEMVKEASTKPVVGPIFWDARRNFIDPNKLPSPLGAWEKYAQTLLLSNEFFYVE